MTNKPVIPRGFKEVEEFEPCPQCGKQGHTKIGPQKYCVHCGHQWPPIPPPQLGPTRRDVLNGTARFAPTKIIRCK